MIQHPIKKLLPAIMMGLFLTLSIAATGRDSKAESQDNNLYTIKDAGLQFEVPKGWKAEVDKDNNVVLSVEDGAVSVTFVVEEEYKDVVAGMKQGLKERLTEMKSDGDPQQDTHNGMSHTAEGGTGLLKNSPIRWRVDVLKAGKPVTILTFGIAKVLDAHIDDYAKLVTSIKKI
jgi:hypothetical protein